jgi:anaerobic magnesium-protoporphyrin IX monomethyl ester cyclase
MDRSPSPGAEKPVTAKNHIVLFYPRFNTEAYRFSPGTTNTFIPLPLLFVSNPLLESGFRVTLIDGRFEDFKATVMGLKEELLLCGVSCLIPQVGSGLEFSRFVKSVDPNISTVWGGWHSSIYAEQMVADPAVDFVVRGEGEATLLQLCQRLQNGDSVQDLEGITYKVNGRTIENPDRPPAKEFPSKRLPFDLLKMENYGVANGFINYVSSRGCPHRCGFCAIGKYSPLWKGTGADHIVSDLEFLKSKYRISRVEFVEDNFFANPKRVRQVCERMIEANLDLTWRCNGHVNELKRFDQETFDLCRRAGMNMIMIGVESGSAETLKSINKVYKREDLVSVLDRLQNAGIPACTNFIVGFPNESEAAQDETFSLMKYLSEKYPANLVRPYMYHPIPGTNLYEMEKGQHVNYPETLEGWTTIRLHASRPWDPVTLKYRNRNKLRKKCFYFWLSYLSPRLNRKIKTGRLKYAFRLANGLARLRYERNLLFLPFEWWVYKALYILSKLRAGVRVR